MNISIVIYYLATMVKVEAICMLIPCVCSLFYREPHGLKYFFVAAALFVIGKYLTIIKPKDKTYYRAESFLIVGLGWIVLSIFGAIPIFLSHDIPNFFNAVFEVISGFTTTGASIINDLSAVSKTTIMWRATTQFIGGMGVLVLMLALFSNNTNNLILMQAEAPGPTVGKIKPHTKDTASILYLIYIGLTIITIVSYYFSGMSIFDAICFGFTTAATGGFATTNEGVSNFSPLTLNLMTFFMFLFGINFNVFALILMGRIKDALKSEELKLYVIIIIISTSILVINSVKLFTTLQENISTSIFTTVSMMTTTGYNLKKYSTWVDMSRTVQLIIMCIGGCAGSTAGGLKISRCAIIVKQIFKELNYQLHPQSIKHVKFENRVVDDAIKKNINSYFIIYINIILVSILLLAHQSELHFETVALSVIDTFNNIGVSLSRENMEFNFNIYDNFSKFILMMLMLIGRLEIIPILALFHRRTWSRKL